MWKLYEKAGQPGWAAIVPGYNSVVMGKIAKLPMLGIVLGVLSLPFWLSNIVGFFHTSTTTTNTTTTSSLSGTVVVLLVILIVYAIVGLYLLNRFIKQYDRGIGSWILYIFFPIIGVFFVNKAKYIGDGVKPAGGAPTTVPTPTTPPTSPTPPTNPLPPQATPPANPPTSVPPAPSAG